MAGNKYASSSLKKTLWISSRKDGKWHAEMSHCLFITYLIKECHVHFPHSSKTKYVCSAGRASWVRGTSTGSQFHSLSYLCRHFGDGASGYLRLYPPPPLTVLYLNRKKKLFKTHLWGQHEIAQQIEKLAMETWQCVFAPETHVAVEGERSYSLKLSSDFHTYYTAHTPTHDTPIIINKIS